MLEGCGSGMDDNETWHPCPCNRCQGRYQRHWTTRKHVLEQEKNAGKAGGKRRAEYAPFFERKTRYWDNWNRLAKLTDAVTQEDKTMTEEERGGFPQDQRGPTPLPQQPHPRHIPCNHDSAETCGITETQFTMGEELTNECAGIGAGDSPSPVVMSSGDACKEYLGSLKTKPKTLKEIMARNDAIRKLVHHHGITALRDALVSSRNAGSEMSQTKIEEQFQTTVRSWRNESTESIKLSHLLTSDVVPQYEKTFSCEDRHCLASKEGVICSVCGKEMNHEGFQTSISEVLHSLMLHREFAEGCRFGPQALDATRRTGLPNIQHSICV